MFKRIISKELESLLKQYPVVTVTGPRQSGRTTLVKQALVRMPYYNLEDPETLDYIMSDVKAFLHKNQDGAILDEIQRAPSLLSYIQVFVDTQKRKGIFVLTGSHQLQLHKAIDQSLAGRVAILELLPLSIQEMNNLSVSSNIDELIYYGFYPGIHENKLDPIKAYRNYVRTYIERDVRELININNLSDFRKLYKLAAGRIGGILNVESLSNDIGVHNNTIKNWLSMMEASYLIYRLPAYHNNFGKRLIKSPKLYFTDIGIASYLLGIENVNQIATHHLRGSLFENIVLLELVKYRMNIGLEPNFYFFRDNKGREIDIILEYGEYLIPIEIKSTTTFKSSLIENLTYFKKLTGKKMLCGFLIYAGKSKNNIGDIFLLNYQNTSDIFKMIANIKP